MKIMIEIPDDQIPVKQEVMNLVLHFIDNHVCECTYPFKELPKGHGDLVELDWIYNECTGYQTSYDGSYCYKWADIKKAPTVIEADK